MITREFNLYLHAGHSIPLVINVNQYDSGETWVFTLFNSDGTQYIPSSGDIVGIKSDNLGIINAGAVDGLGRVLIDETEQMTAAVGKAVFELVIDEGTHGTANFVVLVEPKPGDNADLSETDISMIEQAIEAASTIKPYGSPLVASTVAGMTDHEKVYVYVGSETGYTSGNWYYWDGSAWTSGGVYNSVAVQTDTTLTLSGVAADAKKTGDEISDLKSEIQQMGGGIPTAVREAMATLFNSALYKVTGLTDEKAVINSWASTVTAIALNQSAISISGSGTYQLVATTTPSGGAVTWASSNTAVATVSNNGLVTSVGNGAATITASSGDISASCTATITGFATLTSISAVYTQVGTVYTNDSLDSLKDNLVVTATYSDSSSATLADNVYTLSGTIAEGTQTITVSYQNKSTTFTVSCVVKGWLYRFNESLLSSGSEDFNLTGTGVYDTGLFDRKCYKHFTPTSGTASSDTQYGLSAFNLTTVLDYGNDFTISGWLATQINQYAHLYDQSKSVNSNYPGARYFSSVTSKATGWTVANAKSRNYNAGFVFQMNPSDGGLIIRFTNSGLTASSAVQVTPPSSFDTTQWHHYAITRKGNTVRWFVDGTIVAEGTASYSTSYASGQVAISTNFNSSTNNIQQMPNGDKIQDLYLAPFCKWESDFDTSAITY